MSRDVFDLGSVSLEDILTDLFSFRKALDGLSYSYQGLCTEAEVLEGAEKVTPYISEMLGDGNQPPGVRFMDKEGWHSLMIIDRFATASYYAGAISENRYRHARINKKCLAEPSRGHIPDAHATLVHEMCHVMNPYNETETQLRCIEVQSGMALDGHMEHSYSVYKQLVKFAYMSALFKSVKESRVEELLNHDILKELGMNDADKSKAWLDWLKKGKCNYTTLIYYVYPYLSLRHALSSDNIALIRGPPHEGLCRESGHAFVDSFARTILRKFNLTKQDAEHVEVPAAMEMWSRAMAYTHSD